MKETSLAQLVQVRHLTLGLLIRKSEGCNRGHLAAKEGAQLELIAQ